MSDETVRNVKIDRVVELLGLSPEIQDSDALDAKVKEGLPAASADRILAGMMSEPILKIIPERALRRAKSERLPLSREKSKTLYDFARVYEAVDRFYDGRARLVMRFLEKPHSELGGASPMGVAISSPAGANAVIDILESSEPDPAIQ